MASEAKDSGVIHCRAAARDLGWQVKQRSFRLSRALIDAIKGQWERRYILTPIVVLVAGNMPIKTFKMSVPGLSVII